MRIDLHIHTRYLSGKYSGASDTGNRGKHRGASDRTQPARLFFRAGWNKPRGSTRAAHDPLPVDMLVTPGMKVLYVIALVSFAALLWTAFAIARHVRRGAQAAQPPVADPTRRAIEERLSNLTRTSSEGQTSGRTASRPQSPDQRAS